MSKSSLREQFPSVSPVRGEPLRYFVQSRSRTKIVHLVDLTGFDGNGECSCERFAFSMGPNLVKGITPGLRTECAHITLAKRYLAAQVIRQTLENARKRCSPSN